MYGNAAVPACSASPAALHCLSFTVTPALSCEVQTLLVLSACTPPFPRRLSDVLLSVNVCVCVVSDVQEYITVSQLSHIFGMQRVAPSSSSSVPSFQLTSAESNFLCHSASRGPSSRLSAQVGCVCLYYHLPLTSFHSGQVNFDGVSPRVPLLFSPDAGAALLDCGRMLLFTSESA